MGKKFYYKKKYYKVSKSNFNYIASHYLKYKMKAAFMVNIRQEGMIGNYSLPFSDIMDAANDFAALSKHFFL